jgi:arylsulfatase A-like enzyme
MVRDREWKYVWNATAVDELYHLPTDPGELRNRVHDPDAQAELRRLRQRLLDWMRQTKDLALNAWVETQISENLIL